RNVRLFFFSSRRRHTRWPRDWSSDVCSSDLIEQEADDEFLPESLMGPEINEGPPHIHRFRQKNVGRSSPNNQQHGDLKDDDEPERRLRNHAVGRKRAENFTRKGTSASSCRVACGWCCACSHRSSRWLHGIHSEEHTSELQS